MNRRKLNLDVLLMIMAASSALKTQSRMMRTCSMLRRAGARILLKDRDIEIREDTKYDSFFLFMRAEEGKRYQYLHSLTFWSSPPENYRGAISDLFFHVASRSGLKSLSFLTEEYDLLSDPQISNAVAQIASIKHLRAPFASTQAITMIRNSRSQFRSVILGFKFATAVVSQHQQG